MVTRNAQRLFFGALAVWLFTALQPWSYNYPGFAVAVIDIAGGQLRLELLDHAGKKQRSYCLFSTFTTSEPAGEPIAIILDSLDTPTIPGLRSSIAASGYTVAVQGSNPIYTFFEGQPISKLVYSFDEPLHVRGRVEYKGAVHPFALNMTLQHWEKARRASKFCV